MSDLRFISLELENFKTFAKAEIKLDRAPGLYFIQGRNLLEPELGSNGVGKSTIFDALLWVLFGKTGRDNRPADAVKPWAGKKGSTRVHLQFERGDNKIDIIRTRNPNSIQVFECGQSDGVETHQDDIPKILGMSEEMFRRTLVLGQFGTLFLDLRPEQQSQMFTEALSLDVWLHAVHKATIAVSDASITRRGLENDQAANDALLKTLADDIEETKEAADDFDVAKDQAVVIAEASIKRCQKAAAAAQSTVLTKPNVPVNEASRRLVDEIGTVRQTQATLKRDLTDNVRDLEKVTPEIDRMAAQEKQGKKLCNMCGQEIGAKEFAKQLADLKAKQLRHSEIVKTRTQEVAAVDARLQKLTQRLQDADDAFKDKQKAYDNEQSQWIVASRAAALADAFLKQAQNDLKREQATTNPHRGRIASLKQRLADEKERHGKLIAALDELGRQEEQAKYWVEGFREIRLSIIDQTLTELEMASSRHAAMLGLDDWGIRFDTERETASGKVSIGFTVMLYPLGQEAPVRWESYSGGESQRWQLAVSMALSEVLLARAGLLPNIEVYDEPTRGLSTSGVDDLLERLRDRALELGRAIYFVDHHSLDKGSFDGTLLVTKDRKGSRLEWV